MYVPWLSGSHWYKCVDLRNLGSVPLFPWKSTQDEWCDVTNPTAASPHKNEKNTTPKGIKSNIHGPMAFRKLSATQHVVSWTPFGPWSRLICLLDLWKKLREAGGENHQNFQPGIFTCYLSTEKKTLLLSTILYTYWYTEIFEFLAIVC